MATAKKAAKKAPAKKAAQEGPGEEDGRQEGAGEEGREEGGQEGRQEGAGQEGCEEGCEEEGASQEEGASEKGRQEGRQPRRPPRRRLRRRRAKKAPAKKAAKKAPAKKAAAAPAAAPAAARGAGEDGTEPASGLAVPDGQQALRERQAPLRLSLNPASAGFFICREATGARGEPSAHDLRVGEAVRRRRSGIIAGRCPSTTRLGGEQRLLELRGVRLRLASVSARSLLLRLELLLAAASICLRRLRRLLLREQAALVALLQPLRGGAELPAVPPAAGRPGDAAEARDEDATDEDDRPGRVSMVCGLRTDSRRT